MLWNASGNLQVYPQNGAHSAPNGLKNTWIQTSRSYYPVKPTMTGAISPWEKARSIPVGQESRKGEYLF
jgi:hypothetical protein